MTETANRWPEVLTVALFVLVNLLVPVWIGELHPFTSAPMFADAPQQYCNYEIYHPEGHRLAEVDFGLGRNYWGNPIGAGVGIKPPATVDRFGEVTDPAAVTEQVEQHLVRFPSLPYVEVVQEVIGPMDANRVGPMRKSRWRVRNPKAGKQAVHDPL